MDGSVSWITLMVVCWRSLVDTLEGLPARPARNAATKTRARIAIPPTIASQSGSWRRWEVPPGDCDEGEEATFPGVSDRDIGADLPSEAALGGDPVAGKLDALCDLSLLSFMIEASQFENA
jgi:hypothetical protein